MSFIQMMCVCARACVWSRPFHFFYIENDRTEWQVDKCHFAHSVQFQFEGWTDAAAATVPAIIMR